MVGFLLSWELGVCSWEKNSCKSLQDDDDVSHVATGSVNLLLTSAWQELLWLVTVLTDSDVHGNNHCDVRLKHDVSWSLYSFHDFLFWSQHEQSSWLHFLLRQGCLSRLLFWVAHQQLSWLYFWVVRAKVVETSFFSRDIKSCHNFIFRLWFILGRDINGCRDLVLVATSRFSFSIFSNVLTPRLLTSSSWKSQWLLLAICPSHLLITNYPVV